MDNLLELRPGRIINTIFYDNPSSDTTVFLLHGLGGRGQQWREQVRILKEKYRLVVPDLFGHGKSGKPASETDNPYSFTEHIKDLQAVFNQFSSQNNIIFGHSYGGALATSLAMSHQNQLSKLVLICPIACAPINKIPSVYYLPSFMLELLRPLLEKQFYRLAFDVSANPALVTEEIQAARANSMHMIKSMIRGMKKIPMLDVATLTIPTLILLGKQDGFVPPTVSQQFYKRLPYHQFEMINHAAHLVMLEKPEEVNAAINRFL